MELEDWELLHNSPRSIENENPRTPKFHAVQPDEEHEHEHEQEEEEEAGGRTHSMIRADHFSLDKPQETDSASDSDSPSWIDPSHQFQGNRNPAELWSDSASDRSDDRKVTDFSTKAELGIGEFEKGVSSFDGIGKLEGEKEKGFGLGIGIGHFDDFDVRKGIDYVESEKIRGHEEDSGKFWSDSGGDRVGLDDVVKRDVMVIMKIML